MHEALILFISTQQGSNLDTFRVKLSNTPVILLIHSAARSFIFRKNRAMAKSFIFIVITLAISCLQTAGQC